MRKLKALGVEKLGDRLAFGTVLSSCAPLQPSAAPPVAGVSSDESESDPAPAEEQSRRRPRIAIFREARERHALAKVAANEEERARLVGL
eukprot:6797581-Prymnesium_polylepis.1